MTTDDKLNTIISAPHYGLLKRDRVRYNGQSNLA